jgi:hypothetical protein
MTGDLHADANRFIKALELKVREHVMRVSQLGASVRFPLENIRFEHYIDIASSELIFTMKQFVINHETKHDYADICPKSAWQHIKLEYAPKWFLRMFPVEYQTVSLYMNRVYPEYPLTGTQIGRGFVTFVSHKPSNKFYENT